MKSLVLIVATTLSFTTFSQQETPTKFGKGLYNVVSADSSWSMKFGLRFQSLFIGEWNVNQDGTIDNGTSSFLIRRSRLKFGGFAFSPKLKYKIELGLSNKDLGKVDSRNNFAPKMILDAVLKWNFYQNFELWGGQTKLPGNRERVISSANMQFVDRSMLNKVYNIDRDMGFQLRHHFTIGKRFVVREAFAVSQGEGRNLVQNNLGGFQYTSRVEFLPFGKFSGKGDYVGSSIKREKTPKLSIGATYDVNERAVKNRSNQGSYMGYDRDGDGTFDDYFQTDITSIFVDWMFKYQGFSFMGEYAYRDAEKVQDEQMMADSSMVGYTVQVGSGVNLSAGYMFKNNWEVAARYCRTMYGDVVGRESFDQYTFGVSKFIVGHKLKVQTDVTYSKNDLSPTNGLMYRLQFDIHF